MESYRDAKLVDYSYNLAIRYSINFDNGFRKKLGQFFTPPPIAEFMANLFTLNKNYFSILDPGAGTGILFAAFCDRILKDVKKPIKITLQAYESDNNIIPLLESTINSCKERLEDKGHSLRYNLINSDFILENAFYIQNTHKIENKEKFYFDYVISNPPYFKLNKSSVQAKALDEFISGQPNIYALFMILATNMLKSEGEFVYITPRSFCSGLYYKRIRKWFINNTCFQQIHNFKSRKKIFNNDKVLQEVVIFTGKKTKIQKCNSVIVSSSNDNSFLDYESRTVNYQIAINKKNPESIIRIPHLLTDFEIIKVLDNWDNTLLDFGMNVSTGKIVDFRNKEFLLKELEQKDSVPLIWMQNLSRERVFWPINNSKAKAIRKQDKIAHLLIPVENYVVIKRFTSKCQERRLFASPLLKNDFREFDFIGLENHLNYIYSINNYLSEEETLGISAILNTTFMDRYFRSLSGNTQVNAAEMRTIPFPDLRIIRKVGRNVNNIKNHFGSELDKVVADILELAN